MPNGPQTLPISLRDGTSQLGRILRQLDPDYAQIEERTTQDLLAFARAYSRELKYFDLGDPDSPSGDWSGFIGSAIDLDTAAAYAQQPESLRPELSGPYARPHFALFLASLQLFRHARGQLNGLTRRHLEFFYRDVLGMVRKKAVADKVHVLVDLDSRTDALRLPAGTALRAGRDGLGRDLVYVTERELVANRAQVARVSSLHAEIRVTGIREASRQYRVGGTRNDAFVAMLEIALGEPNPGDPLPVPVYPNVPPPKTAPSQPEPEVTFDVLVQAQKLVGVVEAGLGMPLFDDYRALMRLKRLRKAADPDDWKQINAYLAKAGKNRDPGFTFNPQDPADFQTNLRTVLNKTPAEFATLYDGLPEVKSIEEAYAAVQRPDVADFIEHKLYLSLDDFKAMMQVKLPMDNQWEEINRLLEEAGRRKRGNVEFELPENVRTSRDFEQKLNAAVNAPDYTVPGGLDAFHQAFLAVERYFFMPAESFKYMMSVATRPDGSPADEWDWERVYEIVAAAHAEKIYARRRDALSRAAQDGIAQNDSVKALAAVLAKVLDAKVPDDAAAQAFVDESLQRLDAFGVTRDDLGYLQAIASKSQPAPDWPRVYAVLETAQRNREGFQAPVAEKVEWRNLYPAPDARQVPAYSGAPDVKALPRWKTFGRDMRGGSKEPEPQPASGWAIGSPLLALSEGTRSIVLTLGFASDPDHFDLARIRTLLAPPDGAAGVASFNPFQVELSTAKGWVQPATAKITWANPKMGGYPAVQGIDTSALCALSFTLGLLDNQPALARPVRALHGVDAPSPILRLMVKPVWIERDSAYVTSYQALRSLLLRRARLQVSAAGLANLFMRNDQTTLDAKKPFEPFGISPAAGSRFYLGHPELVAKKLDSVTFNITWMGLPAVLGTHYANYPNPPGNASFTAKVALADGGVARDFPSALSLFDPTDATKPVARTLAAPADQGNPGSAITSSADVTEWNRYLLWELKAPDFQHAVYPTVALQKSLELAVAVAGASKPASATPYQVNPPVTPKIKSLTVDYGASVELAFDGTGTGTQAAHLFHIEPFGYSELAPEGTPPGCLFLPQYDFEGELYIGLSGTAGPQNLALLFQVAEGSADPDLAPEPVQWDYLSGNRWLTLHNGSLIADATRGLINSGIVELALPPALPSTRLPPELYWLRAAIARSADSVCDMVEIHANAALATFDDRGNALDHLSQPLAPLTITEPLTPIPEIAGIRQPYTSFGGKMAELDMSFYVRVSERLRHKQRALTPWDYERLVLEKFPRLYKVKCLRADPVAHPREPGRIELIVIPDIKNRLPFDPFEPKAPADLIRDVQKFLQDKTPAFAQATVRNAHYVPVKVRCGVRFLPGQDESFSRKRLNDELNRFLSPWAYDEGADLAIGGKVYANSIIDFIERLDYVDYIAELKLFTSQDQGKTFNLVPETADYHAAARRADDVLVAARDHQFDVISHADYRLEVFSGINYMKIELDFIVA
jgi:Baseplate J-like protein